MRPIFLFNSPEGNPIKLKTVLNEVILYEEGEYGDAILIRLKGYEDNIKIGYDFLKNELKLNPYNLISRNFKMELDDLVCRNIIKEYHWNDLRLESI